MEDLPLAVKLETTHKPAKPPTNQPNHKPAKPSSKHPQTSQTTHKTPTN